MSVSVLTNVIFGFKTWQELSQEAVSALWFKGITVSPVSYDDEFIIGIKIGSLDNVGGSLMVSELAELDKVATKKKVLTALKELEIDIPEGTKFGVYVNNLYC